MAHEFNASNYKTVYDLDLQETELDANIIEYSAEMELPYGEITIHSIFWFIPVKDEEIKCKYFSIYISFNFSLDKIKKKEYTLEKLNKSYFEIEKKRKEIYLP